MSITEILADWKDFAQAAVEVKAIRSQLSTIESQYNQSQARFQKRLQELEEDERDAILEIISAYEGDKSHEHAPSSKGTSADHEFSLKWLLNKVGNEGVNGIKWPKILNAWEHQFHETPSDVLYQTLNNNRHLFAMNGERQDATLKLTGEGHALFLNGA